MTEDRVLLVDDEEEFVLALSKRLKARGLDVVIAESGEKAVEIVTDHKFDAIVLDLAMPGMDGIETLKRLLEIDRDAQVILLTGHGTVPAATEAMKIGAADFLEKPCDFQDLMAKLREAIRNRLRSIARHSEEEIADILRKKGW
jgi:DNA-binding NtrC family response regulator